MPTSLYWKKLQLYGSNLPIFRCTEAKKTISSSDVTSDNISYNICLQVNDCEIIRDVVPLLDWVYKRWRKSCFHRSRYFSDSYTGYDMAYISKQL